MSASEATGGQDILDSNALLEAERRGTPFLVFRDREDRQRLFCFAPDGASTSVGRLPSADLVIDWDRQVSRQHARFERDADAWVLVDDGLSSNGTFINEARLSGRHRLRDGDVVRVGATRLVFRSPASDEGSRAERGETPGRLQLSSTQRRLLATLRRLDESGLDLSGPVEERIAQQLVLSVTEVRGHLEVLCAKLGVQPLPPNDRNVRLLKRASAQGLISDRVR